MPAAKKTQAKTPAPRLSIAEIAEATGANPKSIRAYLRANHSRSLEAKNSRWGTAKENYRLSAKLTGDLLDHYAPKEAEAK